MSDESDRIAELATENQRRAEDVRSIQAELERTAKRSVIALAAIMALAALVVIWAVVVWIPVVAILAGIVVWVALLMFRACWPIYEMLVRARRRSPGAEDEVPS